MQITRNRMRVYQMQFRQQILRPERHENKGANIVRPDLPKPVRADPHRKRKKREERKHRTKRGKRKREIPPKKKENGKKGISEGKSNKKGWWDRP